jgi:ADP-heptose:LPS heptosyltransferase
LEPLFKIPDFTYVSIQKKVSVDEANLLESYGVERPSLDSFTDTVRMLERCELVISVCTSVAHLAASMGIPTWILIPYIADWRWLIHRNDSPWYPSVKLFRQNRVNSWEEPILEITQSLLKKVEICGHPGG